MLLFPSRDHTASLGDSSHNNITGHYYTGSAGSAGSAGSVHWMLSMEKETR